MSSLNIFRTKGMPDKRGQDPLGIQHASQLAYQALVPAFTNLSRRFRFYSFYSWVISEYRPADGIKLEVWLRRNGLLLALVMNGTGVGSIPGRNYVKKKLSSPTAAVDIAYHAKHYLKHDGFLQYYGAIMHKLGLLKIEDGEFRIADDNVLAAAFCEATPDVAREIWLEVCRSGYFETENTDLLRAAFNPKNIAPHSNEWHGLNDVLYKTSALQTRTIEYLIPFVEKGNTSVDLPKYLLKHRNKFADECADGWIYYALCERVHYAAECILAAFLDELSAQGSLPLGYYPYTNKAVEAAEDIDQINDVLTSEPNLAARLKAFECRYEIVGTPGAFFEFYGEVCRHGGEDNETYLKRLTHNIVMLHSAVAFRKSRGGHDSLLKFEIDDGHIRFVDGIIPAHTEPRLRSLEEALRDMGLIQERSDDEQ